MDEPKLHHANLYLPSLPPEYQPELLNTILNSNSEPWLHFVDVQCLYTSMRTQAEHWLPFEVRSRPRRASNLSSPIRCQDSPLPAPSTLPAAPPFVPVDTKSLFDPTKVIWDFLKKSDEIWMMFVSQSINQSIQQPINQLIYQSNFTEFWILFHMGFCSKILLDTFCTPPRFDDHPGGRQDIRGPGGGTRQSGRLLYGAHRRFELQRGKADYSVRVL